MSRLKSCITLSEGSPKARQRFEAEAKLTGRLDHPGIVPVYDCGRLESGRWYFAMRRIPGVDLREHIDGFRFTYRSSIHLTLSVATF